MEQAFPPPPPPPAPVSAMLMFVTLLLGSSCTPGTCTTATAMKRGLLHLCSPVRACTGCFSSRHLGVPRQAAQLPARVISLKSCDSRWRVHRYHPESRQIPRSRKGSSTGHPRLAQDTLKQAGVRERLSNRIVRKSGSRNKKCQDKLLFCPPISFLGL